MVNQCQNYFSFTKYIPGRALPSTMVEESRRLSQLLYEWWNWKGISWIRRSK